jgi:hypothetical protein
MDDDSRPMRARLGCRIIILHEKGEAGILEELYAAKKLLRDGSRPPIVFAAGHGSGVYKDMAVMGEVQWNSVNFRPSRIIAMLTTVFPKLELLFLSACFLFPAKQNNHGEAIRQTKDGLAKEFCVAPRPLSSRHLLSLYSPLGNAIFARDCIELWSFVTVRHICYGFALEEALKRLPPSTLGTLPVHFTF